MRVQRSIDENLRTGLSTQERLYAEDEGLIDYWETGRKWAAKHPLIAEKAKLGELVPLPWKGGFEKKIAAKFKYGTYRYLAMWQGLRGDNLNIDTDADVSFNCAKYGTTVIFTHDLEKFGDAL